MTNREERNVPAAGHTHLKKTIVLRFLLMSVLLGVMFFWTAGTLRYWQAWTYMAVLLIPMFSVVVYFLKKDPEALERRMRTQEKESRQKIIVKLGYPVFLAAGLLPGFDRRFGWSAVPAALVIAADLMILASYLLFIRVLYENRYAGRTVEVEQEQKLITTGPYAVVRHPMYAAIMPIYMFSPLALGSFWAVIPALLIPVILVARIFNEEELLKKKLEGYSEYTRRVKYRLIPGIW